MMLRVALDLRIPVIMNPLKMDPREDIPHIQGKVIHRALEKLEIQMPVSKNNNSQVYRKGLLARVLHEV